MIDKYQSFIDQFDSKEIDRTVLSDYISLLLNGIPIRDQEQIWEQVKLVHNLVTKEQFDCTVLSAELLLAVYSNYYKYNVLDGITTTRLDNPIEVSPREHKLSEFEKNFENSGLRRARLEYNNTTTSYYVTNQTGLYGIILWYMNGIKFRNSPASPSHIFLESGLYSYDRYTSNLEIIRQFAETLKLIK